MRILQSLIASSGFAGLTWQNVVMFAVAGTLIYLAVRHRFEPLLLVPIGFGAILANLPFAFLSASNEAAAGSGTSMPQLMQLVYDLGIRTEILPPVIFLGVGALTDFRPLISRPSTFLLGAGAQFGVFVAAMGAFSLLGFSPQEAASIGIIGGADGPTAIFLTSMLAPHLLGAVAVAAYSYMALVPIIQPPVLRLLTTKKERELPVPEVREPSRAAVVLFPVVTGLVASLAVPTCAALVGMLMFGNLLRESGVTDRLSKTAGGSLVDIATMFIGLVVGSTMSGRSFLDSRTLLVLALGAVAFVFSTAGGILLAKAMNLCLPESRRFNPCIGAAGVSAVPMAARVVQDFVSKESGGKVNPLMAAMGPNVAGVLGTAVAAGVFLTLLKH